MRDVLSRRRGSWQSPHRHTCCRRMAEMRPITAEQFMTKNVKATRAIRSSSGWGVCLRLGIGAPLRNDYRGRGEVAASRCSEIEPRAVAAKDVQGALGGERQR